MAESSWPSVAGSRVVTDDQFELMSVPWSPDGVEGTLTQTPVFGDSSGRQVKVRAGVEAIVGGHGYTSGPTDVIKAVSANASGSTRIDAVVLQLDRTTWAVTSVVKAGTPGAGVPPALTRNTRGSSAGVWEIPVAMVSVANGAATISAANVTDIAWYVVGDMVSTTSTNPLQPPATDYTRMRHSDTGIEYTSVAGAWRRSPWSVAWGIIGGRRYNNNTQVAGPIGTSEALGNMSSNSVSLIADRRYRITARFQLMADGTNRTFTARLRETNLAGAVAAAWQQCVPDSGWNTYYELSNEIVATATTSKTYVLTVQTDGGLVNVNTGTASYPTGIWVEDVGPAVPSVVTITP